MFELPKLAYAYNELEPHIDGRTMEAHYTKHHQAYITNLNNAVKDHPEFQNKKVEELLSDLDSLPDTIRTTVRNNGGGHYNHSLFWKLLKPKGGGEPTGKLVESINKKFGSFTNFKDEFTKASMGRFGSGWAWLALDKSKNLMVYSTPNQDTPVMEGFVPVLGLDVWEHAYYLNYQNRRADYVSAWWNVVNWDQANKNLEESFHV